MVTALLKTSEKLAREEVSAPAPELPYSAKVTWPVLPKCQALHFVENKNRITVHH